MDTNMILIIIGLLLILWLASRFFNRAPTTPTYDDENTRSGGSIGGGRGQPGQRTHDDPTIESGGSIGGRSGAATPRTHDDPNIRSGGSFGSSNVQRESNRNDDDDKPRNPFSEGSRSTNAPSTEELRGRSGSSAAPPKRSGNDDSNTRSGGSFGG